MIELERKNWKQERETPKLGVKLSNLLICRVRIKKGRGINTTLTNNRTLIGLEYPLFPNMTTRSTKTCGCFGGV